MTNTPEQPANLGDRLDALLSRSQESFNARMDRFADLLERGNEQQQRQHENTLSELRDLKLVAQEQSRTARQQQETIRQFVGIVADLTRTISEMSRTVSDSVESSRRAAQAAETAAVVAQTNQNAIRDLIEEMRERRNGG
jgi:methyl-accepting chemotaxis protein